MQHSLRYVNNDRVKIIKFEDFLLYSETLIQEICEFLDIDFEPKMLNVPVIGSSTEQDKKGKLKMSKI